SGGRTHPRYKVTHAGFESRAQHRPGLASSRTAALAIVSAWVTLKKVFLCPPFPRSSNGRTAAFGAVNRGSNPCRGAKLRSRLNGTPRQSQKLRRNPKRN